MEIQKKVQIIEVKLFDGEVHHIDGQHIDLFVEYLEKSKFVKLRGRYVNVKSISSFGVKELPEYVSTLDKRQQNILAKKIESTQKNLGREPSDTDVHHWTTLLLDGKTLTY